MYELHSYGLLHSDICGSILACNSPQLFAAYHVLLRLPMPRHSPCALLSLTIFSNSLLCSISHAFEDFFVVFFLTSQPTFVVCFRKIFYFLFSSCIFTLLYSVFKVLTWPLCGQLGELLLRLSPRFASQTVILFALVCFVIPWWAQVDSNHRPHAYQACALTTWAMSPWVFLRKPPFALLRKPCG